MTEKEFKELNGEVEYVMWSSPDQARSVVEIGREELIELERLSWQVTNFVKSFFGTEIFATFATEVSHN